uniref:CX domain-containing protein n=1 Tax=Panagrolaimus sp. ES5 TaxID=591445 RepID=A0AC34GV70_9BILA
MAAEPNAPWSRWDAPGFQYVSHNTQPPNRQFDTGQYTITNTSLGNNGNNNNNIRYYDDGRLVDSRPNANDPAFIDCVYQSVNGGAQIVQQCYKDFGCCDRRCCEGSSCGLPPPSSMGGPPPPNQGMPGPYYQPYGSKPYQY